MPRAALPPAHPRPHLETLVEQMLERYAKLRRPRTDDDLADCLPEIASAPRYSGHQGPAILRQDLRIAVEALDRDERKQVELLLGLTEGARSISDRRQLVGLSESGSARAYRERLLLTRVCHHLIVASNPVAASDPIFDMGVEVRDLRAALQFRRDRPLSVVRTVTIRAFAVRPGVRVIPIPCDLPTGAASRITVSLKDHLGNVEHVGRTPPASNAELTPSMHLVYLDAAPPPGAWFSLALQVVSNSPSPRATECLRLPLIYRDVPRASVRADYPKGIITEVTTVRRPLVAPPVPIANSPITRTTQQGSKRTSRIYTAKSLRRYELLELTCSFSAAHLAEQAHQERRNRARAKN